MPAAEAELWVPVAEFSTPCFIMRHTEASIPHPAKQQETLQSFYEDSRTELGQELTKLGPWFHNIRLNGGIQTAPDHPLDDFPAFKWREISAAIPEDLTGWSVLDVGCNAGFYSFELAKRGARVDAIDADPHYLRQAKWAAQKLGLTDQICFRQKQIYELAREPTTYDLVWFMGVFYHLRYPLLGLDILARKTQRLMVFQTLSLGGSSPVEAPENLPYAERGKLQDPSWPRMAFIENRFAGDATNWWVPDAAAVEAMLRSSGFQQIRPIADETWRCEPGKNQDTPPPEYTAILEQS